MVMSVGRRPGTPVMELVTMVPTAVYAFDEDVAQEGSCLGALGALAEADEDGRAHVLHADVGDDDAVDAAAIDRFDVDAADDGGSSWGCRCRRRSTELLKTMFSKAPRVAVPILKPLLALATTQLVMVMFLVGSTVRRRDSRS